MSHKLFFAIELLLNIRFIDQYFWRLSLYYLIRYLINVHTWLKSIRTLKGVWFRKVNVLTYFYEYCHKSCIPLYHLLQLIKTLWFRMLRISSFLCSGVSFLVVAEFINEMHSFWWIEVYEFFMLSLLLLLLERNINQVDAELFIA